MNKNLTLIFFLFLIFPLKVVCGDRFYGEYKVGKSYRVGGEMYYPQENYNYTEIGRASWYGSKFYEKKTANGAIFNKGDFSAAHRTLPMPSVIRATNLENGRSMVVIVNDRGPYAKSRIVDFSESVAERLGFKKNGHAKVKITILENESKELKEALLNKATLPKFDYSLITSSSPQNTLTRNLSLKRTITNNLTEQFYVQIGSFNKENFAKAFRDISNVSSNNVDVYPVDNDYKVRVGPFDNEFEARKNLKDLRVQYVDAFLVFW